MNDREISWPRLPLAEWRRTQETLHLWMQVVGKIRLGLTPLINHWWNSTLYLTARGLTTGMMPLDERALEIRFDFVDHQLLIESSHAATVRLPLQAQTCATFYETLLGALRGIGAEVAIWPVTCELPELIRLDQDRDHTVYVAEQAHRWWRVMLSTANVLEEFRGRFYGKSSPVHFFWGSFDLAITRFNGRRAPAREGADAITREAYSHEVISAGFWPGSGPIEDAAFYAYAAPQPDGFANAAVKPAAARYDTTLGEFVLMYEDVRRSEDPHATLMDFLQSTYDAAASLAGWDRAQLDRSDRK